MLTRFFQDEDQDQDSIFSQNQDQYFFLKTETFYAASNVLTY